jgi:hypothetical protein
MGEGALFELKILTIFFLFILILLFPKEAVPSEVKFSGAFDYTLGGNNDLDFNKDTYESILFRTFMVNFRDEITLPHDLNVGAEAQTNYKEGDKGNPYNSFSSNYNKFKLREGYLKWLPQSLNTEVTVGFQALKLPSVTFGNPLFEGHTSALNINTADPENLYGQLFIAYPLQNDDRFPRANSAVIAAAILDIIGNNFDIIPYFIASYLKHQTDSTFAWASAPDDDYSYLLGGGLAAKYIYNDFSMMLDLIVANTNNTGVHHYENKGYFSAVLLEYQIYPAMIGLFAWYSSGNSLKLQHHNDYGILPTVGAETSFAPTRLAFKGDLDNGRDSALTDTGAGTGGFGFHLKDIYSSDNLRHILRLAYITGTSNHQGNGTPAAVITQSPAKARGEPGLLTSKDYVVEIDFDTIFNISDYLSAALEAAYIFSGFKDKEYDTDSYSVQYCEGRTRKRAVERLILLYTIASFINTLQ